MSPAIKNNISRIIPFGLIWFVFSFVYTLLEKGLLANLGFYPSSGNTYNFHTNIFITPALALITGLLIGVLEILYFNDLFSRRSFSQKIIFKSLIYLVAVVLFVLLLTMITNAREMRSGIFSKDVWEAVLAFITKFAFISVLIFIGSIILVSQFYNEVRENMGQAVLHNFLTGKYHRPTEEERIFMFLDMKASTTIAERLGHVKYFELLRDYYADFAKPIIDHCGEIYQYVGDEIVVSWKMNDPVRNSNCITCFFNMKTAIQNRSGYYRENYGVIPDFKAGLHVGRVTTGEIGINKKDIIFTGDVLNTTARIQALCNHHQSDLLISEDLRKLLGDSTYAFDAIGESELRGRQEKILLHAVTPT